MTNPRIVQASRDLLKLGYVEHAESFADIRPSPEALAASQAEAVSEYLDAHTSTTALTWCTPNLQHEFGHLLPSDLMVVGASAKAGKTTFLLSQLDHLARRNRRTLYFPLEMTPRQARIRWAALRLGLQWDAVASRAWDDLPEGSLEALRESTRELAAVRHIQFPPDAQATVGQIEGWTKWAIAEFGAEVVIVDHFHRLDMGGGHNYRVQAGQAVRALKNLALETGVVLILSAQFRRSSDPFDLIRVPGVDRFKETGALVEEAEVALVLSRGLRRGVGKKEMANVRDGRENVFSVAEPGQMRVGCVAHRRRDLGKVGYVKLEVSDGVLRDRRWYDESSRTAM